MNFRDTKRFTMLELVAVIAIIIVIMGILIPVLSTVRQKAAYTRWQSWSSEQRRDPKLDAYYVFEQDKNQPKILRNVAMGDPTDSNYDPASRDGDFTNTDPTTNPVWKADAGRFKGKEAMVFDGTMYVPLHHAYMAKEIPNLTVACWTKTRNTTFLNTVISYGKDSGAFSVALFHGTNVSWAITSDLQVTGAVLRAYPDDEKWHHVVGVYKADGGVRTLWIDGKIVQRDTNIHNGRVLSCGGAGGQTRTFGFIGASSDTDVFDGTQTGNGWRFLGTMDEVMVYHRALEDAEVEEMYKVGIPASSKQ